MSAHGEVAGIDVGQWLALTRTRLRLDIRQRSFGRTRMGRQSAGLRALAGQAIFYAVYGLVLSALVRVLQDLLLTGIVLTTFVMFVVGTAILLDYASTLTSADDYMILGFRPITSRTYFAVRLTNILLYTTLLTTLVAWLPIGALAWRHGAMVGAAGFAAIYGSSFATAFALLLIYAWMLRLIGPNVLQRALGYVQMFVSFAIYGGYFLVSGALRSSALTLTRPRTPWILLAPPTWFAAYLEIAAGRANAVLWSLGAATAVLLAGLAFAFGGRTSTEFAERLGGLTATARPGARAGAPKAGWWFRSGESRAVALLVRSQFRNDQRFKMGVLGIVPMTLLYLYLGTRHGGVHDPFVTTSRGGDAMLIGFAVMMFPAMLKLQLTRSESFRASWIFFVSPASRARLVRASTTVVIACFLAPYLAFVGGVLAWSFGHVWHALAHTLVLGLFGLLVLQVTVLIDPELPFAKPPTAGRNSSATFGLFLIIAIVNAVLQIVLAGVYRSPARFGAFVAGLVLVNVFAALLTRTRVDGQARDLEFAG